MRSLILLLSLVALSACSPTQFFGNGQDSDVLKPHGYRKINTACAAPELSSTSVTPPVVRALVHCFNAYGALEAADRLVGRMSDDEIAALIGTLNRQIFDRPERFFEIDQTLKSLDRLGLLDSTVRELGKVFEQKRAILGALRILKTAKESNPDGTEKALRQLSTGVSADTVGQGLELGLNLLGSRAYSDLERKLRGSDLASKLRAAWRTSHEAHPDHIEITRALSEGLASGELLPILTELTSGTKDDAADGAARLAAVFRALSAHDGKLFVGVTRLFHAMNGPVSCLQGAAFIPNGNIRAMEELARNPVEDAATFVQYQNQLKLLVMNSFCTFPSEVATYYPQLVQLAQLPAIEPMGSIIASFVGHGKTELLANLLSEVGGHWAELALPAVEEIQARGAWEDLLLLVGILQPQDLQKAARAVNFAWDAFAPVSNLRIADEDWEDLLSGLGALEPALDKLRGAYLVNDSHPLIEALRGALGEAGDPEAVSALLRISELPEFPQTLDLLAAMSRDGRLEEIIETWMMLFHRQIEKGAHPLPERSIPAFVPARRHDLVGSEVPPFDRFSHKVLADDACRALDLSRTVDRQWNTALECVNSDRDHDDVVESLHLLETEKTAEGKSLIDEALGLFRDSQFGKDEYRFIVSQLIATYDSGELFRWLKEIPLWVGEKATESSQVLGPLVDLAASLWNEGRARVRSIEQYLSGVLRWQDFPAVLRQAREFAQAGGVVFAPGRTPIVDSYARSPEQDLERLERWVGNKECSILSGSASEQEAQKEARARQIIDEYRNRITNWDLVDGSPRRSFTAPEWRGHLSDIVAKLADPSQSVPERPVARALFNVLKHFEREGAALHESAGKYLVQWAQDRSSDWQPITFYYPGEDRPRVTLVNTLDRLELTLINVDFKAPGFPPSNFGLKFMGELAEAWGDEPRAQWPEEIQKEYPEGSKKRPPTIRDWVESVKATQSRFEKLVGYPKHPDCVQVGPPEDTRDPQAGGLGIPGWVPGIPVDVMKRSLYNNREVMSVLDENSPDSEHRNRGGLRFLRDLFFELAYSTPEKHRNAREEKLNNLAIVLKFARMGLARQLGQQGWTWGYLEPRLISEADRIIRAGVSPEMDQLVTTIGQPASDAISLWQLADRDVSSASFDLFKERLQQLRRSSDYQSLDMDGAVTSLADFFAESSDSQAERDAARKLRLELASKLESGSLDEFVELASRKPDDFYRVLMTLGQSIDRGEIQEFLGVIRRSLSAESR